MSRSYDVAIVGFGPVGALTALALAQSGLRVAILERSSRPVELPRAVGLDGESMRSFQRLGFVEDVAAILQPPRDGESICFTDSKRNVYFGTGAPPLFGSNGWRDLAFFDQPELEALLREKVAERSEIDVFIGHEVTGISQDAESVSVTHRSAAGTVANLNAAYAIGSDGASSFVRGAVGIEWKSLGYDQDWLVIDITIRPEAELPVMTMQVCDPHRLTSYICVKDPNRRWEFQLRDGETREEMLRPEAIESLLESWLPPEHYAIRRAAVYQFHAATVDRWNEGRVFLAGDAAHQTPPFLGQGLNAGFRDSMNLGWKLPRVLSGEYPPSMLGSYGAERDAHAVDLVDRAVSIGKLMETFAAREAGLPDPHPIKENSSVNQGLLIPPLRSGILIESQVVSTSAGRLLQQPRVTTPDGTECHLDTLLGAGFAIVARTPADAKLSDAARSVFDRIGGTCVILAELASTEGDFDSLFSDHAAAVVRPDAYIFGVVEPEWTLDALILELGRRLELA